MKKNHILNPVIDRIHLDVLHSIHCLGTVTAASKHLHLTQSAVSHILKKLETNLQTKLMEKQGRTLRFTQSGRYLVELAERVLPQFEHAVQALKQFSQGKQGGLRIGMECHPCRHWLNGVVKKFIQAFPGVDLDVEEQFRFNAFSALIDHEIDVVITPDPVYKNGLEFYPVFDYEFKAVLSPLNPLSRHPFLNPDDFSGETLFTYPVPMERLDIFTQFLIPANYRPATHKTMQSTDLMMQLVSANRGLTALPDWLIEYYQKQHPLTAIPLGQTGIHKHIYVGIRSADQDISYLKGFIDFAKEK